MDTKQLYIKCSKCGYYAKVDGKLFAKILGGFVSGFGFWAWISFLFAGTGFALPLCIAIMTGGVALVAFSEQVVNWMNRKYNCPVCRQKAWFTVTYDELQKDKTIRDKEYEIKEKEEIIRKKNEELDQFIKDRERGNISLTVDSLKEEFYNGICTAKREIDIHVPRLGKMVFEADDFKSKIFEALNRGCLIKIRCGHVDENDNKGRATLQRTINGFIADNRFNRYYREGMLRFCLDDSHAKLAIFDDNYYLIGSMNFLSNPGDDMIYNGEKRSKWEELGEKSRNIVNLHEYRNKYFSF